MIKLRQPALALNSFNVPNYEYSMWKTWKMPKNTTAWHVLHWILAACDQAPEQLLKHVVRHAHGGDGRLYIGEDASGSSITLNMFNVGIFSQLRTKNIATI
jgi:hypothetical protein